MKALHRASAAALALVLWGGAAKGHPLTPAGSRMPGARFGGRTTGLVRQDGLFPLYIDARQGRVLMEVERLGEEFLYGTGLAGGAGLAEAHLDRAQLGDLAVCRFERADGRLLLHQVQTAHRASVRDPAQQRAVEESFPSSIRAALPIVAEEAGVLLVDATELALRDPQVMAHLHRAQLGEFHLDRERSAVLLERTGSFPRNTEIEALLTFAADRPARAVAQVMPDERTLTLRVHHTFMRLPEPGYTPLPLDPRVGLLPLSFKDFALPASAPLERLLASRWRLARRDPGTQPSPPREPLVFYLDPAIPEPERSAVRAGVLWWNEAFFAAGYRDAIVVRDLPPGASFLDARYSGIAWVHRADRGWSSGEFRQDPRTGEILHAVVRLDSHRRRTVAQLWQTLRPEPDPRSCQAGDAPEAPVPDPDDPQGRALVLARLAYLAAHEVGHTLGLAHHFAASVSGFSSVMDYYAPNIRLVRGQLDVREAYPRGIGSYDKFAIRWAYGTEDAKAREELIRQAAARGILYTLPGDAHWVEYDLGPDPVAFLHTSLSVRRAMLAGFRARPLRPGEPLAEAHLRFPLAYLYHRYALQALAGLIGGQRQVPAYQNGPMPVVSWVPADQQRRALAAFLGALEPAELDVPDHVLAALVPPAEPLHGRHPSESGPAFSALQAARSLAALAIGMLLAPERAARLTLQAFQQGPGALGLQEVLEQLVRSTWGARPDQAPRHATLRRVVQRVVVEALVELLERPEATPEVRAQVYLQLQRLRRDLAQRHAADPLVEAHLRLCERDLGHALDHHGPRPIRPPPSPLPPVRPIGG
ncbi:MAG: zinc-dependent metalloprotease [Myxococcales bacterium]|nr:zinc-dependent metalloprotease [Myxococcota bacterium]MDW8284309.1 zinc-dependent metalloprotease [Myxococcales bacterium]